jgi:hypothetical protein
MMMTMMRIILVLYLDDSPMYHCWKQKVVNVLVVQGRNVLESSFLFHPKYPKDGIPTVSSWTESLLMIAVPMLGLVEVGVEWTLLYLVGERKMDDGYDSSHPCYMVYWFVVNKMTLQQGERSNRCLRLP